MSFSALTKGSAEFCGTFGRGVFQKSGFGGCSPRTKTRTRVHSDVPPERKPERGYVRMFPRNESGTRAHSPKPPLYETALLSHSDLGFCRKVLQNFSHSKRLAEAQGRSKYAKPCIFDLLSGDAENLLLPTLGNGRNTVSRVLFRRRELTEFCGKLGEFCDKLGESLWHTNNRLGGTH